MKDPPTTSRAIEKRRYRSPSRSPTPPRPPPRAPSTPPRQGRSYRPHSPLPFSRPPSSTHWNSTSSRPQLSDRFYPKSVSRPRGDYYRPDAHRRSPSPDRWDSHQHRVFRNDAPYASRDEDCYRSTSSLRRSDSSSYHSIQRMESRRNHERSKSVTPSRSPSRDQDTGPRTRSPSPSHEEPQAVHMAEDPRTGHMIDDQDIPASSRAIVVAKKHIGHPPSTSTPDISRLPTSSQVDAFMSSGLFAPLGKRQSPSLPSSLLELMGVS
ncbi:hypothetical protein BJ912DRAFT_928564 [Pholiota molesta]|nr:hypothetical protein BJ912DRAFT_928564 [Pholiota molesta]